MKFKIEVQSASGSKWWEEYDKNISDPKKWAVDVIDNFNETLRTGEEKRNLISVVIIDKKTIKEHSFMKTNLVTIIKSGGVYDEMKCNVCGVTGKRRGLSEHVEIDYKYRAKVYSRCDTSIAHLKKKKRKKQS